MYYVHKKRPKHNFLYLSSYGQKTIPSLSEEGAGRRAGAYYNPHACPGSPPKDPSEHLSQILVKCNLRLAYRTLLFLSWWKKIGHFLFFALMIGSSVYFIIVRVPDRPGGGVPGKISNNKQSLFFPGQPNLVARSTKKSQSQFYLKQNGCRVSDDIYFSVRDPKVTWSRNLSFIRRVLKTSMVSIMVLVISSGFHLAKPHYLHLRFDN